MLISVCSPHRPGAGGGPAGRAVAAGLSGLAVGIAAAALAAGCDNPVSVTPNAFDAAPEAGPPAELGVDAAGGGGSGPDAAAGPCDCLAVDQAFRFDSLVLTSLDGGPHRAIPPLNTRWGKDIENHELDVYFIVTAVEARADGQRITMRSSNGALVAGSSGEECEMMQTAVEYRFDRQGCTLTMTESAAINVYEGNTEVPKNCSPGLAVPNTIPVQGVRLQFDVTPDCGGFENGTVLEGGIARSALKQVCTCLGDDASACLSTPQTSPGCDACPGTYANLEALVKGVNGGDEPAYGCQTPAGEPAMCMQATFTARRLPAVPTPCAAP